MGACPATAIRPATARCAKRSRRDTRRPGDIPEAERDYYLERMYPAFGNLAPRDIASRAAKMQCDDGRGVGPGGRGVYLDFAEAIGQFGQKTIAERYGNLATVAGVAAGESLVELLEARQDDSPIAKFVAKRGPGIHHVCFAVDDLDGTLERCRTAGLPLIDQTPRIGAEGKRIAFLHPSATGGVLVELSEH